MNTKRVIFKLIYSVNIKLKQGHFDQKQDLHEQRLLSQPACLTDRQRRTKKWGEGVEVWRLASSIGEDQAYLLSLV